MSDNKFTKMEHEAEWRTNKSMSGCLTYLSQNKMWHDVSFSFKNDDGKILHGHRLILSLRSPVFEAMFFGSLADKQDTVDIVDIEHDIFDHILRYIYTDESNLDGDNVIPILYGAKKYCLPGLAKACSSFLGSSMTFDNVCTIYEHAKMFNMNALVQTCLVFMANNSSAVSLSESSTCLSHESLLEFLSSEDLSGGELQHFHLVNNWAEEKCKSLDVEPTPENKRAVIGEIVTKINYTRITPVEFSEVVVPTNILLAEDQIRLFQYIITGNKTHIDKYVFPTRNRYTIDTRRLEGQKYEANQFIFTFISSHHVQLMKLFPLKMNGWKEFGRNNIDDITVTTEVEGSMFNTPPSRIANVPVDKLDESGSITNKLDVLFLANTKYTVRITLKNDNLNLYAFSVKQPSITTLKLSHTTKAGPATCTIEHIPDCVEAVEFKVIQGFV